MVSDLLVTSRSQARRVTLGTAAAGTSSFALLYAPQPVLAELAADFDLDPGGASLAVTVATAALAIAVLPMAMLSEVVSRRSVIVVSVTVSLLLGLLLPLAPSYPALLVLRALQGVSIAGVAGVASAYLVERLGRAGVAAAVGVVIAGNSVGGMLGRLLSGLTADGLGWRGAFAAVAGVAVVCSAITTCALPRSPRVRASRSLPRSRSRAMLAGMGAALRRPVLLAQYVVAFLAMGSFVALYNAAGFRLTGAPFGLSASVASLVFLAYALGAVSSVVAGVLVGRLGRRRGLVSALLLMASGVALTLPDRLPFVIAGFVVLTGGFFAAHAVANGWAAGAAPERARGQVSGTYTMAYYLGGSVGGTVGSVVFGHLGWSWLIGAVTVWLLVAVAAVVAGSWSDSISADQNAVEAEG